MKLERNEILAGLGKCAEKGLDRLCEEAVKLLYENVDHYDWVGIYVLEGEILTLSHWRGGEATEHIRMPVGRGICGSAALSGKTEVVDDVTQDGRYLACFLSTKSEIVVPILVGGAVVAEIDIDSNKKAAFDIEDRIFLEQVAALIAGKWKSNRKGHADDRG